MSRSSAGVAFESPCEWLGHVHRTSGYRGAALVVPQALAFSADRDFKVALGVRELATVSRQKRDTVIAQLRQLAADGWVDDAGRRRGRGAGRGGAVNVLSLTLPSLLRVSQVPPGRFGRPYQVAGEGLGTSEGATGVAPGGLGSATGVAPGGLGSATGVAPGGLGTPHTPQGVGLGRTYPTPTPPQETSEGSWTPAAEEVLSLLPARMRPNNAGYRAGMLEAVDGWLDEGFTVDMLVAIGSRSLPANIASPLGLLRGRVALEGRPRSRSSAGTPTPEQWRTRPEERLDGDRLAQRVAETRAAMRGAG